MPVIIGDRKDFRFNDSGFIFCTGKMHFQVAKLNPEIRQRVINRAIWSTQIGSSNREIAGVVHIEALAPGIYFNLLRVEAANHRMLPSGFDMQFCRGNNSGWQLTPFTSVVDFISKEVKKGRYTFVPEVGNLYNRELVEETIDSGDHKKVGIPGIHSGRQDPGGDIASHTLHVRNIVLYVMRFHCFRKGVTAAGKKQ